MTEDQKWVKVYELLDQYEQKFGDRDITIIFQDPAVLIERLETALKTGKRVVEPKLPPGVLI